MGMYELLRNGALDRLLSQPPLTCPYGDHDVRMATQGLVIVRVWCDEHGDLVYDETAREWVRAPSGRFTPVPKVKK